jgi:hypothetical protein
MSANVARMISRLRRKPGVEDLLAEIDELRGQGRDAPNAIRLLGARHRAGVALIDSGGVESPADPQPDRSHLNGAAVPEVHARELTPEVLRASLLERGCLLVRELVAPAATAQIVDGIDRAYAGRDDRAAGEEPDPGYFRELETDPRFNLGPERTWMGSAGAAGLWLADSPLVSFDVLEAFDAAGLRRVATEYPGERPAISANKSVLRRVVPDLLGAGGDGPRPSTWHQDGAFLGEVRALNVWLSLSRCGDRAPGLDVVPRRLEQIVATGTDGASFDWAVAQSVASEVAGEVGIHRPIFEPGDALLFDQMLLHGTAVEPDMPDTRYAVECWFFGPSAFPEAYAPLAF